MLRHDLLLQDDSPTPLGRLRLAGYIRGGRGVVPPEPLRVYGSYAVMCVLRGTGGYRDANGLARPLAAGDAVLVFPELGHWYGTRGHQTWDEMYVVFDGPAFDQWRAAGVLDAARPVAAYPEGFPDRLRALLEEAGRPSGNTQRMRHVTSLLALLSELTASGDADSAVTGGPTWAAQARAALDTDLGLEMDMAEVAADLGVSYESFRKRFLREVGVPPARYRTQRRIEAAKALLRYSPRMTNRQVAETLGFADEYHFSRRFTQITGGTPREFRADSPDERGAT